MSGPFGSVEHSAQAIRGLVKRPEPRPLLCGPKRFVLLWSPKAASASALLWFYAHSGLLRTALRFSRWPHDFRWRVLYASGLYLGWIRDFDPASTSWLKVIRHPEKRAVSSFRHAVRYGIINRPLATFLRRNVAHTGFTFDEYLHYLLDVDLATADQHHREQVHPIEEHVVPRILNVDKEDLWTGLANFERENGIETLDQRATRVIRGASERISVDHHARRRKVCEDQSCRRFTRVEAEFGGWPVDGAFLGDNAREKIRTIYRKDFRAYAAYL